MGLRLWGMVEEPPRPSPPGSEASLTSSGVYAAGTDQRGQPVTMGVPRPGRILKSELLRQLLTNLDSAIPKRRQGSAGAAELQHRGLFKRRLHPPAAALDGCQPPGGLQTKRHRGRGLKQSAAQHHGLRVRLG
jgi:hypothetical protein